MDGEKAKRKFVARFGEPWGRGQDLAQVIGRPTPGSRRGSHSFFLEFMMHCRNETSLNGNKRLDSLYVGLTSSTVLAESLLRPNFSVVGVSEELVGMLNRVSHVWALYPALAVSLALEADHVSAMNRARASAIAYILARDVPEWPQDEDLWRQGATGTALEVGRASLRFVLLHELAHVLHAAELRSHQSEAKLDRALGLRWPQRMEFAHRRELIADAYAARIHARSLSGVSMIPLVQAQTMVAACLMLHAWAVSGSQHSPSHPVPASRNTIQVLQAMEQLGGEHGERSHLAVLHGFLSWLAVNGRADSNPYLSTMETAGFMDAYWTATMGRTVSQAFGVSAGA